MVEVRVAGIVVVKVTLAARRETVEVTTAPDV